MIFKILDESNNPFTDLPFNSPMSSNKIGIIYLCCTMCMKENAIMSNIGQILVIHSMEFI